MKSIYFIFLLFLYTLSLCSQGNASLSGQILDVESKLPLPFVTVILLNQETQQFTSGTITDESGRFVLTGIPEGEYILRSTFVGYSAIEQSIYIGQLNDTYSIGIVLISSQAEQLEEVVIEGSQSTVATSLDRKTYAMTEQHTAAGGTVLDALKNLPGVTVDQEGKVLLRGSDQVLVLVDGKQSSLTGFGNQRGLDHIPVANIENIEIINNPSARYDASGMAGIINIIYKKESESGWNSELGFAVGAGALARRKDDLPTRLGSYRFNPKFIPSLNTNFRTDKINTFLQSEILFQKRLPNNEFTTREYIDGPTIASQVPENRSQTHYLLKSGLDWTPDDENTLSLSAVYDYESHIDTSQIPYLALIENRRERYWHWKEVEVTGFFNMRLNFLHEYPDPGHEFNTSIQYTRGWEDEEYLLNDSTAIRQSVDTTHIIATEHIYLVNLDYTKPMKIGRLELGSQFQWRDIPVSYETAMGQQSIIFPGLGDHSGWNENIYSVYGNFIYDQKLIELEAGLRIEQTDVAYEIDPVNIYYPDDDAYDYFEAYPNVRLTFKPDLFNNLSLFFNRRVDRPGEPHLRIFPKYDDPELLKVGNPYLRPQFTETVEIAYKRNWENGSAFAAAYHRSLDHPFTRIYSHDESNADHTIINKIYQNVGSGSHIGLEFLVSQSIGSSVIMSTSVNWYKNKFDAFSGTLLFPYKRDYSIAESEENTWDFKWNGQFLPENGFQLQLSVIYMAGRNIPQGRRLARSSVDLGFQYPVLSGRGELVGSFSDVFNRFGIKEEIEEDDFHALYENYFETQIFRLGFKYKW